MNEANCMIMSCLQVLDLQLKAQPDASFLGALPKASSGVCENQGPITGLSDL